MRKAVHTEDSKRFIAGNGAALVRLKVWSQFFCLSVVLLFSPGGLRVDAQALLQSGVRPGNSSGKSVAKAPTETSGGITSTRIQTLTTKAMNYFDAKQFDKAADVFDAVLQSSAPARLTYYAAVANQNAGRNARATALFQFVVSNFPDSTEAKYSQTSLANGALSKAVDRVQAANEQSKSNDSVEQLMEKTRSQLSPEMQATLSTPEGKAALRDMTIAAMKNPGKSTREQAAAYRRSFTHNTDSDSTSVTSKLDSSFIQIAEKTQYSEPARAEILKALALIPESVKTSLFAGGLRIIIDSDSSNMGKDPGFDAAGMYVARENVVHIAERSSTRVLVAYVREVILHEMGHAFDEGKSNSEAYLQAYQAECDKLNANDTKTLAYYVTTDYTGRPACECFAELFKVICEAGSPQAETGGYVARDRVLAKNFPQTMALIKTMLK